MSKIRGNKNAGISSATLHIMAMFFMLLDHTWATVLAYDWMTWVGRMAFPIFAFMIVEGFYHTGSLKRYALRLFIFALISEIPFNLMYAGSLFYPIHQNVLWTFLLALGGIWVMEKARSKGKIWLTILTALGMCLAGIVVGYGLFVDYYGFGIITVFVFYFFNRNREDNFVFSIFKGSSHKELIWNITCLVGQIVCLYIINVEVLGGLYVNVTIFGKNVELVQQSMAMLSLIPIWLYKGKQGFNGKWFKFFNYCFYPAHCLVLALLGIFLG